MQRRIKRKKWIKKKHQKTFSSKFSEVLNMNIFIRVQAVPTSSSKILNILSKWHFPFVGHPFLHSAVEHRFLSWVSALCLQSQIRACAPLFQADLETRGRSERHELFLENGKTQLSWDTNPPWWKAPHYFFPLTNEHFLPCLRLVLACQWELSEERERENWSGSSQSFQAVSFLSVLSLYVGDVSCRDQSRLEFDLVVFLENLKDKCGVLKQSSFLLPSIVN